MKKVITGGMLIISVVFISGCQSLNVKEYDKIKTGIKTATDERNNQLINSLEQANNKNNNNNMEYVKKYTQAILKTNYGEIKIKFYNDDAPLTVNNFLKLADDKFYDGLIFHRIIKGFMIQGGDPKGDGTGGPGYKFKDEIHANNRNNIGTIAMANAGPNTNGSQFFINVADNNFLDQKHTVFGKVISDMKIINKIENVKTDVNDKPLEPVVIESIELIK